MNVITRAFGVIIAALVLNFSACGPGKNSRQITISLPDSSSILGYGLSRLQDCFSNRGFSTKIRAAGEPDADINILIDSTFHEEGAGNRSPGARDGSYKILEKNGSWYIVGSTEGGCLYGIMDLIEQFNRTGTLSGIEEREIYPSIGFRAIKFNLPWSPYRPGPATDLHLETCRDLSFWHSFLDMMVKNHFNALTLWNVHPFPYLIRARNYPMASDLNDQQLESWRTFWESLFKMAKDRGIETYLVNWNIAVSPEFADAYGAAEFSDTSQLVKIYTRESVTQLINEYPDLTGLGVTLADWMGNWGEFKMTSSQREDWIEDTFIQGMKDANHPVKFIHRAVLAGDPDEMRRVIDKADLPDKTIVEIKFNWSHGHSTPKLALTHANNQGTVMERFWNPSPENYFIAWMIRNEDFFVLRWGDPEFIREHIKANQHIYVNGYFVGSEGYIPAKDYSYVAGHPHKTWKYAFEKQWLFYHLWGRLLFNPAETDEILALEIARRYPKVDALKLLNAYKLASEVPLYLASFYKGTWDFTLYSEGFLAPWQFGYDDQKSPFISIEELINHQTLDPEFLSIEEFSKSLFQGRPITENLITPLELSETITGNSSYAVTLIEALRSPDNDPALQSELDDLETWCQLGYYFANKLMAGVSLAKYQQQKSPEDKEQALLYLDKCLEHWESIVSLTRDRYQPMPYVSMGHHLREGGDSRWPEFTSFHWSNYLQQVNSDIEYARSLE